jgi:hypothetical protein
MRRAVRKCLAPVVFGILGVVLVAGTSAAGVVTQHYDFAEPVVKEIDGYHRVTIEGAWSFGAPGDPVLPMVGARLLLPPGELVTDVRVIPGEMVTLGDGYLVEPGQSQYPLSHEGPIEMAEPDYDSARVFPGRLHDAPAVGRYRGYSVANLALHPVEFEPETGALSYYRSFEVEITTAVDTGELRATETMIRNDARTLARLERMVDNPSGQVAYAGIERVRVASRSLNPDDAYKYLVITTEMWDDLCGDFLAFQTNRGLKAGVFLKSWINANYSGVDEQDRIRNFIIDTYNTWDVEYVLLLGDARDANGIPHRGLYANAYGDIDDDIPADLYYSALDGNWNNDGDAYWGEAGEEDWYPELGIGRGASDTVAEVTNFLNKQLLYQAQPIVSECDEALMVGELLWSSPLTYGGDYKDQILFGGTYDGYTTVGFASSAMNTGTLYDRTSTWSKGTLISLMENGLNIVNHLGHCNVTYSMKMYNSDIPQFDNDGTNHSLNFCYSQGCYNGSYDNRGTGGSYGSDCFAEQFTSDVHGAVAFAANSRYGWGHPGGTNGSSQYFDREFFDAMFGEGIYPIGDANDDSKIDVLWAIAYGANKWVYYEMNIFGDPALELWTAEPTDLIATHPTGIIVGQPDMDVTVMSATRGPVEGARVTVYTDDYAVYDVGFTDAAGSVTMHPSAQAPGTLNVAVSAHDYLIYAGTTEIAPADGPYVALSGFEVDDDGFDLSNGNNNGLVDAGESIELLVTLENVGTETAVGVSAVLTGSNGNVTLVEDYQEFGDITAASFGTSSGSYAFSVSSAAADGEVLPFTLTISDSSGREVWESDFNILVHAPVVLFDDVVADDGGNGNGCLEPGEVVGLGVSIHNAGSSRASAIAATLTTSDSYVTVNEGEASIVFLMPDGTATLSPDFSVSIAPDCPGFHEIVFDLSIAADWGYSTDLQFSIMVAGPDFVDNVESGVGEWTHDNVTPGFVDQWHIETYRNHSPTHSWKFGGAGSSDYTSSADGALVMRPMCVGSEGELTFWHYMRAEEESPTSAWDCGFVQITTDAGATWTVIHPDAGYSHFKNSNTANPVPVGTPCWSGAINWREERFDLAAYEGETVQVRFRFASDGFVTEEGWYVDDINLTSVGTTGIDDVPLEVAEFMLKQNAPNPFNPVTRIHYQLPAAGHVRIDVFNIAGKLVTTLVDEEQEPGLKTVAWDGTNEDGQKVASGVYMYRMQAGDYVSKKRMVLLK